MGICAGCSVKSLKSAEMDNKNRYHEASATFSTTGTQCLGWIHKVHGHANKEE